MSNPSLRQRISQRLDQMFAKCVLAVLHPRASKISDAIHVALLTQASLMAMNG